MKKLTALAAAALLSAGLLAGCFGATDNGNTAATDNQTVTESTDTTATETDTTPTISAEDAAFVGEWTMIRMQSGSGSVSEESVAAMGDDMVYKVILEADHTGTFSYTIYGDKTETTLTWEASSATTASATFPEWDETADLTINGDELDLSQESDQGTVVITYKR